MLIPRQEGQICIVTSNPYPDSIGGEETFIGQYSRFLAAKKIPFVIVSASSRTAPGLERIHVRPFFIPVARYEAYNLLWACLAALRIVKLHSRRRIAVIHSIDSGYAGLASAFASSVIGCRLVVHSHGRRSDAWRDILRSTRDWRAWGYWALQRFIDRVVVRRASKVIAVSTEVVSFLESLGVLNERILLSPSAVETEKYAHRDRSQARKILGIQEDSIAIGYLGRLTPLKGVDVLLDAFAQLSELSPNEFSILIAGEGPLRRELEATVMKRELVGVRFLGALSDVIPFLDALDIFVLPSFSEGSPISLLEAMAAGCPIVASNIQGIKEVAGNSALLFKPGDSKSLAETLVRLKVNPGLRKDLSERAIKNSSKYSTTTIFPRILAFSIDP